MQDLTGLKFNRLTVVEYVGKDRHKRNKWRCKCDCGKFTVVDSTKLKNGRTKSCGCYHNEMARNREVKHRTHGLTFSEDGKITRLYRIWSGMKTRCFNPKDEHCGQYMRRGITVCDEWRNDFKAFHDWAMANGYADGLTIDRIDVNGNYEPKNCRWATTLEQNRNKTTTAKFECNGEVHTVKEWAEITGINYQTLFYRYKHGWTPERALTK